MLLLKKKVNTEKCPHQESQNPEQNILMRGYEVMESAAVQYHKGSACWFSTVLV